MSATCLRLSTPYPQPSTARSRQQASRLHTCSWNQRLHNNPDGLCREAAIPRRTTSITNQAAPSDVFVLDFDGVLVDSEPEITASAFASAALHWPHLFNDSLAPDQRQQLTQAMRRVRPMLVRGYESIVMLRSLLENPRSESEILDSWISFLPSQLRSWNEDPEVLAGVFERTRQEWMDTRTQSWMQTQRAYPGIVDALNSCPYPTYIASSKAGHRVSALSQVLLGLDLPKDSPRLFASLIPPEEKKAEALINIGSRPLCSSPTTRLHFVDDRLDTLVAIRARPELASWRLYLADWGYASPEERVAVKGMAGVTQLGLPQFCELMKFGLVMEVDDGCEPSPEEVAAGVNFV